MVFSVCHAAIVCQHSPPLTEALHWSFLSLRTTKRGSHSSPSAQSTRLWECLRLQRGGINHVHDLPHLSTREDWRAPGLAAARRDLSRQGQGIAFWLTTSAVGITAFARLFIRDARLIRCVEAACKLRQRWTLWLSVVGILLKPSLQQNKKSSPKPWAYEGLPDTLRCCQRGGI